MSEKEQDIEEEKQEVFSRGKLEFTPEDIYLEENKDNQLDSPVASPDSDIKDLENVHPERRKRPEEESTDQPRLAPPFFLSDNEKGAENISSNLGRISVVNPADMKNESPAETVQDLNPLGLTGITKKDDVISPEEILEPEKLEEILEFKSKALSVDTLVKDQYKIIKILKEKVDRNTYEVLDVKVTDKRLILREFVPASFTREEFTRRKNNFHDILRILNSFTHKNLVHVYESFTENYREYYVMEKIEGLTLKKLASMNTTPFKQQEVVKWGDELCETMEFIHYRPKPFTLTSLDSEQVMIDQDGLPKIVNYDLQRFFNKNRTIEFMPDDPTKLYQDVTILARLLFFLLTKQKYSNELKIEWPPGTNEKIQKLLEIACKEGQKTFGDIRVFREKLNDTLVEEKETEKKKGWVFPIHKINWDVIKAWLDPVLSINIYEKILVICTLLFVIVYFPLEKMVTRAEYHRPGGQVTLVSTSGQLDIFDPDESYEPIYTQKEQAFSFLIPAVTKIKNPRSKVLENKEVIIGGTRNGVNLEVFNSLSLEPLKRIRLEAKPSKALTGPEKKALYLLLAGAGKIEVLDLERIVIVDSIPININPIDFVVIPRGSIEMKSITGTEIGNRTLLISSHENARELVVFDAEDGVFARKIELGFQPGIMTLSSDNTKLYIVDKDNSQLVNFNLKDNDTLYEYPLKGREPSDIFVNHSHEE
ncbi:MAG: protein kinase domain-containing protein, partial [Vulcanimicrobiota bacterium]